MIITSSVPIIPAASPTSLNARGQASMPIPTSALNELAKDSPSVNLT